MTTVAWDGTTLAADRRLSGGGMPIVGVRKIRRCADGRLLGGAGMAAAVLAMLDWLEATRGRGEPPVPLDSDQWTDILVVEPAAAPGAAPGLFVLGRYGLYPIETAVFALGSGGTYAIAAMACGRSAAEAVRIASRFDHCTGQEVDELRLEPAAPLAAAQRRRRPAALAMMVP